MRHYTYTFAVAMAMALFAGCQRESLVAESDVQYDGKVKFAPSVAGIVPGVRSSVSEAVSAAARTQSLTLTSEDGKFTLPASLSVTSMEAGMATKADLINEDGYITGGDFATAIDKTFWVAAWDDADSRIIPDNPTGDALKDYVSGTSTDGWYQQVAYRDGADGGHYWMTIQKQTVTVAGAPTAADDEYIWKEDPDPKKKGTGVFKTFYAYANLPGDAKVAQLNDGGTLKQTMTGSGLPDKDVLMGYYEGNGEGDGTAKIKFHHPFAAVRFVEGELADGVKITSIEVRKVYMDDWFVEQKKVEQKKDVFTWTKDGTNEITADDATGTLTMTWDDEDKTSNTSLVIPQNSPALACISIEINGEPLTVYTEIGGWSAGTLYTYKIGYSLSGLHVTLKGDFSSSEIRDVACYNDGGINAFVRAMVVANWVDASGNVRSTCDWTTEGTLAPEDGTLWIKGGDGFYYYKKGIKAGSTTKTRLIKSYKPATPPTGADGLEFNVYMQGIRYDELEKVKEQWPDLPADVEKSLEQ